MRFRMTRTVAALVALLTIPGFAEGKGSKPSHESETGPGVPPRVFAPPANDRCEGAILLGCGNILLSGNTDQATNDYTFVDTVQSCTGYSATGRDIVYKLNVGPGDSLWIDYQSRVDGSIYLVSACGNIDASCLAGADKTTEANAVEQLRYRFAAGGTYYLILDSYGLNSGGLWMAVGQLVCGSSTPPSNDLWEAAIPIPCGPFSLSGSTQFAHANYGPSSAGSSCTTHLADGADVVYRLNISAGDSIAVDYNNSTDGALYIVSDCSDVNGTCIAGADLTGAGQTETLRYKFSYSGVFYLVLDSRNAGSTGTWTASGALICLKPPPANDRCEVANLAPCGNFSWSGNTVFANNDYSFGTGQSCTGFPADGRDIAYRFDVQAGYQLLVNYTAATTDGCMYLVTDCANVVGSCLVGVDVGVTGDMETLNYTFPLTGTYYLILDSVDFNTSSAWTCNGHLTCQVLGVDPAGTTLRFGLRDILPNPSHGLTHITYQLPVPGRTTLGIYDLQGRVVRILVDGQLGPGEHQAAWDGADGRGSRLGAGVYFARLSSSGRTAVRRMIFIH